MFISVENVLYFLFEHCEAEHFKHTRPEAIRKKCLDCLISCPRNGQMDPRNGHGSSASRLRPVAEHQRQYRTGSNSSVEYGDI